MMTTKKLSFLLLSIFCTLSSATDLRRPIDEPEVPVLTGFVFTGKPAQPVHLPANAKGVLFMKNGKVSAGDFQILKGKTRKSVNVALVTLRGMQKLPPGIIDTVKAARRQTYRIEPVEGFQSGQSYLIKYMGKPDDGGFFVKNTFVYIDHHVVNLSEASVQPVGRPGWQSLEYPSACDDSRVHVMVKQSFRIEGPSQWKSYQYHFLTLPARLDNTPWLKQDRPIEFHYLDSRANDMWETQPHFMCANVHKGPTSVAGMSAWLAFFEIDDSWHQVKPAKFILHEQRLAQRDGLAALRTAVGTGVVSPIESALHNIAVRTINEDRAPLTRNLRERLADTWRYLTGQNARSETDELQREIDKLKNHPSPEIQAAATAAALRVAADPRRIDSVLSAAPK